MRRFGSYILIGWIAILLSGCAQVEALSGGEQDIYPPRILSSSPDFGATEFRGQEIEIEFDEFIRLNSPNQNISIIPEDAKIEAVAQGKKLKLSWDKPLNVNTTYSVLFRNAVADITEKNDSVFQFVFSTGTFIDSISYSCFVQDAITQQPLSNVLVGLYLNEADSKPRYIASSDNNGFAVLNYIKTGNYWLRVLSDKNKNGLMDADEPRGFREFSIDLSKNLTDSTPVAVFVPEALPKIRTLNYMGPAAFVVGASMAIANEQIQWNNQLLGANQVLALKEDSLIIYPNLTNEATYQLVVSGNWQDTTRTTLLTSKRTANFGVLKNKYKTLRFTDTLHFFFGDIIADVDTSKIQLIAKNDSTKIIPYSYSYFSGKLSIFPLETDYDIRINLDSASVISQSGLLSSPFTTDVSILDDRELGTLHVKTPSFDEPAILELLFENSVVERKPLSNENKSVSFEHLLPGNYAFRILLDSDNNGKWTTGSMDDKRQPEQYLWYREGTKVRANWEIEVNLEQSIDNE